MSKTPDSWRKAPLATVCAKVTDGTHHSPPNERVGAFKYVTAKNIRPWGLDLTDITYVTEQVHNEVFSRCPPEFEDVLYIKDGVTTGLAAVNTLREPFSMLSSVALLKPRRELLSPYFLKHWLNSPDTVRAITGEMTGTAIRRVVLRHLRGVEVPVPPLNEQKRIVARIAALQARSDAAKEALDAIPPLLEKFRQSVLAAAFRGDLTKKWREAHPNTEPASKLLERIRAERRRRWEAANPKKKYVEPEPVDPSGLPALPEGWCWATAAELCITITDGDHQPPPQTESGVAFLVIGNVSSGVVDTTGCRFVDQSYYDGLDDARRPQEGDLLYTVTGSFGIVAPVLTNEPFCVQRHIAILRPNPETDTGLLGLALASPETRKQAVSVATGTAQMTVPLRGLRGFILPVPPQAEAVPIGDADSRLI